MRIEINLTPEVAEALKKKAEALNHSRKSFIELLCIQEAIKPQPEPIKSIIPHETN